MKKLLLILAVSGFLGCADPHAPECYDWAGQKLPPAECYFSWERDCPEGYDSGESMIMFDNDSCFPTVYQDKDGNPVFE